MPGATASTILLTLSDRVKVVELETVSRVSEAAQDLETAMEEVPTPLDKMEDRKG